MNAAAVTETPEAEFAASLLSPDRPPPAGVRVPAGADAAHRFGVYRNNVVAGLVTALAARFPVARRLVGDDFFFAMAKIYVFDNPPRSPLMFRYGGSFPAFVEGFAPAAPVPYLADVARLEFLRGEAFHAADAVPLAARQFARLSPDALLATRLTVHPSMRLLSSRFPVVSIWKAHQDSADDPVVEEWSAEAALVARPEFSVEVRVLPPGAPAFLSALAGGAPIGKAAARAAGEDGFDLARTLTVMLEARLAVDLS
jgi:hypothetical protein